MTATISQPLRGAVTGYSKSAKLTPEELTKLQDYVSAPSRRSMSNRTIAEGMGISSAALYRVLREGSGRGDIITKILGAINADDKKQLKAKTKQS